MKLGTHPKCGKTYPLNDRHGHCSGCHETYVGRIAFDAHRRGEGDTRECHNTAKHWQDDRGYWHHGEQLTQEQKDRIWGKKPTTTEPHA